MNVGLSTLFLCKYNLKDPTKVIYLYFSIRIHRDEHLDSSDRFWASITFLFFDRSRQSLF